MTTEHKYSSLDGSLIIDNELEIEDEAKVGTNISTDDLSESAEEVINVNTHDLLERSLNVDKFEIEEDSSDNNRTFLYIAACIANLSAFAAGICLGWTSPLLPHLESNITTPLSSPATTSQSAWIGSLLPLGATIGPFAAGFSSDFLGRKKTLLISGIPFVIAFMIAAFASNIFLFYVLRFLSGLSLGTVFTVLPMYIAEIAADSIRGALGSFLQLFVTAGILFSYTIGPYISVMVFNLICLAPPIAFLALFSVLIPESPYFLLAQNKETEGRTALSKLRSSPNVEDEMAEIRNAVKEAKANKGSFRDIFKTKATTKAMTISIGLIIFQQFCAIDVVLFYTYKLTGASMRSDVATIMVGIMQFGFSFITPLFVERCGKRLLLLISAFGMAVSLVGLGYYLRLQDLEPSADVFFWLPPLCLVIYNATHCAGFGPLPWAIMGELFPGNIKSAASTLTASTCWTLAFIITRNFSVVEEALGAGTSFFIFGAACVMAGLFVYKFVPETSGKSFQEIQEILEGHTKE